MLYRFAVGRTSEQIRVFQSIGISPVGPVIANSRSVKCGRASSCRSLLKAGVVLSGHPGWSVTVCPQNLFVSSAAQSTNQQLSSSDHCKMEFVVFLQGLGAYSMSWGQSGPHIAWQGLS